MTSNIKTLYKQRPKYDYGRITLTKAQKIEIGQAFELFVSDKRETVFPIDMIRVFEKI